MSKVEGHFHAVKFYDSSTSLSRSVAQFLADGLSAGQPALVIATPEHRVAILAALRALQVDGDVAQASGDLLVLDAAETLAAFMTNGMPDAERFNQTATAALKALRGACPSGTIRAYGEMVDVLWKQGHDAAAIRVEMLWNKLANTQEFSLLCGYAMGSFYKDAGRAAIHHQHTHVLGEHDIVVPAPAARGQNHRPVKPPITN